MKWALYPCELVEAIFKLNIPLGILRPTISKEMCGVRSMNNLPDTVTRMNEVHSRLERVSLGLMGFQTMST